MEVETPNRTPGIDIGTQVTMGTRVEGVALLPGVSPAECAELCRQRGVPPRQLIDCLQFRHRFRLGRPFTSRERRDLEMLFNFAVKILQELGNVIRPFGRLLVDEIRHGNWGEESQNLLFDIIDKVTDTEVDEIMLRQTLPPVEEDTPSQGVVGGAGQGNVPQADVDDYGFPIPDPDFDIDVPGPYDMWRDPYQ